MDRVILHSDLNNFYASVECMLHPELKDRCIAVCGSKENRHGIVLAKNEKAKKFGVKTAETIWQAKAKCPSLEIVSPHFTEYRKYSLMVRELYGEYTDLIEPFGLDECWLDVTGSRMLFGDGVTIANEIRNRIREEIGLTVSVGVSFNKVFAKLGSDLKKPDAVTEISRENFQNKIWHLPADSIIGVGGSTYNKLVEFGIRTIGDIAQTPCEFFETRFGKHGTMLWQYANGLDTSEVTHKDYHAPAKSIGHGITLKSDLENNEEVWKVIYHLSRQIEKSLRDAQTLTDRCALSIKKSDLSVKEHQVTLDYPTHSAYEIAKHLFALFKLRYNWDMNVRALTVRAVRLVSDEDIQLSFFASETENEKREKMENTAYELENKFGTGAVTFGSLMLNDKLPDDDIREEE